MRNHIQIFLCSLAIFFMMCSQAKQNTADLEISTLSLEQKAIDIFKDSLMFKKIFDYKPDSNQVLLYPHNIDSAWISKGMFSGYTFYSDGISKTLSIPELDSLLLFSSYEYFTDSAINEIKGYNAYFRLHKADSVLVDLKLPDGMEQGNIKDFISKNSQTELFVKTNKRLVSHQTQMVEIVVLKNREEIDFPIEFRFLVYFDLNNNLLRWSFR